MTKIYFICSGTSTHDILRSVDNNIKLSDYPKLENIGFKELLLCQDINNELLSSDISVYTSLAYNAIESALVLLYRFNDSVITPLPYMSNQTFIKGDKNITIEKKYLSYKRDFCKLNNNNNNMQVNHWNKSKMNVLMQTVLDSRTYINWSNIDTKNSSSLNRFDFSKFKLKLKEICSKDSNTLIFVCDSELIIRVLSDIKSKEYKYSKNTDKVEYSSIWEVDVNFTGDRVTFEKSNKIYPTRLNSKTLNRNNTSDTYSYMYNNYKFSLFNSIEIIPMRFIKNMVFNRLSKEHITLISQNTSSTPSKNSLSSSNKNLYTLNSIISGYTK